MILRKKILNYLIYSIKRDYLWNIIEEYFIKEFVNHYKKYGIDKIFLYDNNNINGEKFDDIISNYLKDNFVEIINARGKIASQFNILNHCYKRNKKKYDWLIFYDVDEYIHLKKYSNIKEFLSQDKFNQCKIIYLNAFRHTDNDLLYYDNRPLVKRFPYIKWKSKLYTVKSIIKGHLKGIKIKSLHWLDRRIKGCNSYGKEIKPTKNIKMSLSFNELYIQDNYIDHYCFKSTQEYINKILKGDGIFGYRNRTKNYKIYLYFKYNKITLEKIEYIEKITNLNLTNYKLRLIKQKKFY